MATRPATYPWRSLLSKQRQKELDGIRRQNLPVETLPPPRGEGAEGGMRGSFLEGAKCSRVVALDVRHVFDDAGSGSRPLLRYPLGPQVVSGEGHVDVAVETIQKLSEIPSATKDVLTGVE